MSPVRKLLSITLLCGIVAALILRATAADAPKKKGRNERPPEAAGEVKRGAGAEGVDNLALAYGLVRYGREHKSAEALLTAARILGRTSTTELKAKKTSEKNPKAPETESKKVRKAADDSPKALLAEAKKMSKNDPQVVALANAIASSLEEKPRGAEGGPKGAVETVKAYSTDIYRIRFEGEEEAIVAVKGDGDTTLGLYVYDENDNLIGKDISPGICLVRWEPRWTGQFRIEVRNFGDVYNEYKIVTN